MSDLLMNTPTWVPIFMAGLLCFIAAIGVFAGIAVALGANSSPLKRTAKILRSKQKTTGMHPMSFGGEGRLKRRAFSRAPNSQCLDPSSRHTAARKALPKYEPNPFDPLGLLSDEQVAQARRAYLAKQSAGAM